MRVESSSRTHARSPSSDSPRSQETDSSCKHAPNTPPLTASSRYAPILKVEHPLSLDPLDLIERMHRLGLFSDPTPASRPGSLPPPPPRSTLPTAVGWRKKRPLAAEPEEDAELLFFDPEAHVWATSLTKVMRQ